MIECALFMAAGFFLWWLGNKVRQIQSRLPLDAAYMTYSESTDTWWVHLKLRGSYHEVTFTLPYVGPTPRS